MRPNNSEKRYPSEARIAANRVNAQKSTGPRTEEGKSASSQNAIKHGIYCQTRLLPGECKDELEDLRNHYFDHYRPQSHVEADMIEELVSVRWRMRRLQDAIEINTMIEVEIVKRDGLLLPGTTDNVYNAYAWRKLGDGTNVLQAGTREFTALSRSYERLTRMLESRSGPCNKPPILQPVDEPNLPAKAPEPETQPATNPELQNEPNPPAETVDFTRPACRPQAPANCLLPSAAAPDPPCEPSAGHGAASFVVSEALPQRELALAA